ncbi:MAG: gliding motility-associated ABC transporter ATP-binding subunit GldA [Bacteroidia bacterium]
MATVQVEKLLKLYGTQHAVDNISFSVQKGDVVGFLGPNGAGKSTTMKILTGYILPTSGTASVTGHDIYDNPLGVRKATGYLPEHNPLYHEMYVKEYLRFIGHLYGLRKTTDRIAEVIDMTGLGLEKHKKIGALSKGYRQRVGLAQALLHDPEVLILDEPTSGLDPNQIVEIRNLIREIGKSKTIILSTHIMQEVQSMCNRVVIINRGKLVADSTTEELIYQSQGHEFVRVQFKHEANLDALKQIKKVKSVQKQGLVYTIRAEAGYEVRERIFHYAMETGNIILDMQKEGESLEKIFQELTVSGNRILSDG